MPRGVQPAAPNRPRPQGLLTWGRGARQYSCVPRNLGPTSGGEILSVHGVAPIHNTKVLSSLIPLTFLIKLKFFRGVYGHIKASATSFRHRRS